MAKKNESPLLQVDVDQILYCDKTVDVSGLRWGKKPPPSRSPMWLQAALSPLESGSPLPGLKFVLQWRPADEYGDYPKIQMVALYFGRRIFGVDSYPNDRHTNRVAVSHPDYAESILGPHYHLYFESALPYEIGLLIREKIAPDDFLGHWRFFCSKLNVTCNGDIPLPTQENSGQMLLL
ncbi:hypothetical protein [Atlantibacter hermannii]|uniref:hypothetical protein n=1 Tax=Atlantibacter hermannii TaxID=565 RepID=UPI002800FEF5|nr:hypothetical protein [Atlantibacter hermannii]MDQ7883686.1 hypothetical protein [Atlantibacter hermannii]